jgi:hypothetical protein
MMAAWRRELANVKKWLVMKNQSMAKGEAKAGEENDENEINISIWRGASKRKYS